MTDKWNRHYLGKDQTDWLFAQAKRLDRSRSWILRRCILIAKSEIEQIDAMPVIEKQRKM